jgi:shikimate kinase
MVITLIGYRGTGKTTLAFPLAKRLGWSAIDADAELEHRAGRTIREIFDADGEPEFRRLERELLVELLGRDHLVIASGGGAIMNSETFADVKNAGPVVWLKASVETIERRILGDETTTERRPDLTTSGGRTEIENLLAIRNPVYDQCASITIETDDCDETGQTTVRNIDELLDLIFGQVKPLVNQEVQP